MKLRAPRRPPSSVWSMLSPTSRLPPRRRPSIGTNRGWPGGTRHVLRFPPLTNQDPVLSKTEGRPGGALERPPDQARRAVRRRSPTRPSHAIAQGFLAGRARGRALASIGWREWDVDRRDYMMAEPLQVGADGHIVLSDSPAMGYDLATDRLASTR